MLSADQFPCIFCISSGRAGSHYLATLLGTGKSVQSFHEADPKMIGPYLDLVNDRPLAESREARRIKSKSIREIMVGRDGTYVETNHMFIKTFYDVVLEDYEDVAVVVLRRELARVVKSFAELCYFTSRNEAWPKWMSLPGACNSPIEPIESIENMDQFDLIIGYLIDIEARGERFRKEYPNVSIYETRVETLNQPEAVRGLLDSLGIETTPSTMTVAQQPINQRSETKAQFANPVDLSYCRERIAIYIEKAEARGIPVPGTLPLQPV